MEVRYVLKTTGDTSGQVTDGVGRDFLTNENLRVEWYFAKRIVRTFS